MILPPNVRWRPNVPLPLTERRRCEPPPRRRRRSPRSIPPGIVIDPHPATLYRSRHHRTEGLTPRGIPTFPVPRKYRLADVGEASAFLRFARDVGRPLPPPLRRRPRATERHRINNEEAAGTTRGHLARSYDHIHGPMIWIGAQRPPTKAASCRLTTPREPSRDTAHPVNRSPRSAPT